VWLFANFIGPVGCALDTTPVSPKKRALQSGGSHPKRCWGPTLLTKTPSNKKVWDTIFGGPLNTETVLRVNPKVAPPVFPPFVSPGPGESHQKPLFVVIRKGETPRFLVCSPKSERPPLFLKGFPKPPLWMEKGSWGFPKWGPFHVGKPPNPRFGPIKFNGKWPKPSSTSITRFLRKSKMALFKEGRFL